MFIGSSAFEPSFTSLLNILSRNLSYNVIFQNEKQKIKIYTNLFVPSTLVSSNLCIPLQK